jgi:GT2 family glycosyltransferase
MLFKSIYPNLRIGRAGKTPIEFSNGEYLTSDKEEIEFLKSKPTYGSEITSDQEVSDKVAEHIPEDIPLISVIVISRVGEALECIPSLEAQTYKNLEIIIEYDYRKEGASASRNRGIKKANGEYVLFCDNDLILEPDAIQSLYESLQGNKWAFGRFEWDGIEFLQGKSLTVPKDKHSEDYITYFHGISCFSLVSTECKPLFDEKLRRFDDWDLWVRLHKAGHNFSFCDKILFHTKSRPHGISSNNQADIDKWLKVLYKKHGVKKKPQGKLADIIIPHHDRHDLLKQCLDNLPNDRFNIIVVSGGTFSHNCNQGAKLAETDNLIFLNDDVIPKPKVLEEIANNPADIVGVAQTIPDHRKTFYGIGHFVRNGSLVAGLSERPEDSSYPSGYCFKVSKTVWDELGGFSEAYRTGAEDKDLFLRAIQKGLTIDYVLEPMIHLLSQSEGRHKHTTENEALFDKLWPKEKIIKLLNL